MAPEPDVRTGLRRSMLRWYAALANTDTEPATFVALGDSLLAKGALHPAVDRLVRHHNPVRFDPLGTGYGWWGGSRLAGEGAVADHGGFDGAPRLLADGETCNLERMVTTSIDLFGEGTVDIAVDGQDLGQRQLAVGAPCTVEVKGPGGNPTRLTVRARGDVSLHGAFVAAGNERRGIRYFEICNPGKTSAFFRDHTDAMEHLAALDPDLLLLSVGVNDVAQTGIDGYAVAFDDFVGRLRAALPRTTICYWFPHRAKQFSAARWDEARAVAERVCTTHAVTLIDGYAALGSTSADDDTEGLTYDGVHYTLLGMRLFSETVLGTIAPGLQWAPRTLTTADLGAGQFHVGSGAGDAVPLPPPSPRFNVLHGTEPSVLSATGLFFSEALYLSATEPPLRPPEGSAALYVRAGADGEVELCLLLSDGSVRVLAFER